GRSRGAEWIQAKCNAARSHPECWCERRLECCAHRHAERWWAIPKNLRQSTHVLSQPRFRQRKHDRPVLGNDRHKSEWSSRGPGILRRETILAARYTASQRGKTCRFKGAL